MFIIILPTIIPRFNWARERRLFAAFLVYYGWRARRLKEQLD